MLYVKVYDCLNDKQNCEEKKHNTFFKSYQVLNCPNWLVGWLGGKEVEVKKQRINLPGSPIHFWKWVGEPG